MKDIAQKIGVIYDKECPVCNHFACALTESKNIDMINGRIDSKLLKNAQERGLDIDKGLIAFSNNKFYYGSEAITFIAKNTKAKGVFSLAGQALLRHPSITKIIYPFLVLIRRIILFILGRSLIEDHKKTIMENIREQPNTTNSNVLTLHMGNSFDRLSPLLKKAHTGKVQLTGTATVKRGNILAKLICGIFRFPKEAPEVALTVDCDHQENSMTWKRNFSGLRMESNFEQKGAYLIEHLGPLAMSFKAVEENGSLVYNFYKTRIFGIPIPKMLGPQVEAGEKEEAGKYKFHVKVNLFLIGLVISYSGDLEVTAMN